MNRNIIKHFALTFRNTTRNLFGCSILIHMVFKSMTTKAFGCHSYSFAVFTFIVSPMDVVSLLGRHLIKRYII